MQYAVLNAETKPYLKTAKTNKQINKIFYFAISLFSDIQLSWLQMLKRHLLIGLIKKLSVLYALVAGENKKAFANK